MDTRFKEAPDPAKPLKAFGELVRLRVSSVDEPQITRRLLDEAVAAFAAQGGALYLGNDTDAPPTYTVGKWNGDSQVSVSLEVDGKRVALLSLGARRNGADYSMQDRATLQHIAQVVAQALEQDRQSRMV